MLHLLQAPHPVLSKKAEPISKIDKKVLLLIKEMAETLVVQKDPEGVGLAAPQIGKSLRLFIVKPTLKSPIEAFINPEIVSFKNKEGKKKKVDSTKLEGCLSLKNIWGEVERNESVTITYLNEKGEILKKTFTGFNATIIQHEMDHLEGILFPKRVLEQKGILYKSHKDKRGKDVFVELSI